MQFGKNQQVPLQLELLTALNLHLGHSSAVTIHLGPRSLFGNVDPSWMASDSRFEFHELLSVDFLHTDVHVLLIALLVFMSTILLGSSNYFYSCSTLNSHGGYYTSLLSQDGADEFVSGDYVLDDN